MYFMLLLNLTGVILLQTFAFEIGLQAILIFYVIFKHVLLPLIYDFKINPERKHVCLLWGFSPHSSSDLVFGYTTPKR